MLYIRKKRLEPVKLCTGKFGACVKYAIRFLSVVAYLMLIEQTANFSRAILRCMLCIRKIYKSARKPTAFRRWVLLHVVPLYMSK